MDPHHRPSATPPAGPRRLSPLAPSRLVRSILHGGLAATLCLGAGCSLQQIVVDNLASSMAGGAELYRQDDDPEMIRDAMPFGLKLLEQLHHSSPDNAGLAESLASGYTFYAKAFLEPEIDRLAEKDLDAAEVVRERARKLYRKARSYALAGLEVGHPGRTRGLREAAGQTLAATKVEDVPLLYWLGAAWGSEIALSKNVPSVVADLGLVGRIMKRARELQPDWGRGALHEFFIVYDGGRPQAMGGSTDRARKDLELALAASDGQAVSPLVSYAETVAVALQDRHQFRQMLRRALAVDPETTPEDRLANILAQRRARYLLAREDELFL